MKKYVFITWDVGDVGGSQHYTAGKILYLEKQGWVPICISPKITGRVKHPLEVFSHVKCVELVGLRTQPNQLSRGIRNSILRRMAQAVDKKNDDEEIVIESQETLYALWGEMLAERVNGKHILFNIREKFDEPGNCNFTNIDFLKFKFLRKEFISMNESFILGLFKGVLNFRGGEKILFCLGLNI